MKLADHLVRARARRLAEQLRHHQVERTVEVVGAELDELERTPNGEWTAEHERRRGALFEEYGRRLREEQLDVAGDDEDSPA